VNNKTFGVLFLCTGNSARSIMAESILNGSGRGRFKAHSAGSFPTGQVNPYAIELLQLNRFPVTGLRSKSWDEFIGGEAPPIEFVFTVCDKAAQEPCPAWPTQVLTANWGVEDPAAVQGSDAEKRRSFWHVFTVLQRRIDLFTSLPFESLDSMTLQTRLRDIGRQ
jgi:protein-tyrosine-phosphatase